ncbi:MAG: hypothetical protein JSV19_06945 [Phycisphaerales bacterium]|nr:MAG: hypothetical protein JSV19_06945 [Phycisphaerales bacterium]
MSIFIRNACVLRGALLALGIALVAISLACPASTPTEIAGPVVFGNEQPTMEFTDPVESFSINRGELFTVSWRDSDPDSAAKITLALVDVDTDIAITIISGLEENDRTGPDSWAVDTTLLSEGPYYIRGTISDSLNAPFVTFAQIEQTTGTRVVVNITPQGWAPSNTPPTVVVLEPFFNQSVAQDDALQIVAQPVAQQDPANPTPYDQDSDTTLYIALDLDDDPTNDSVQAPDPDELIVLRTIRLEQGRFDPQPGAPIIVDLTTIPPRPNGEPYFIRATIDDDVNPQVHAYAPGILNVVQAVSGTVDLAKVGLTLAGVRWIGFNPGAQLGSTIEGIGDFDADGVDDVVLVAQFGNPRARGNIGEAYLVYGLDNVRWGNTINVNSVSTSISGVIFEAPMPFEPGFPVNGFLTHTTLGITDVGAVEDVDFDGRPELIFGMPHVDGAWLSMDFDPGDTNEPETDAPWWGCYPDLYANNFSTSDDDPLDDNWWYWGGFAAIVSSQNRDNSPLIADAPRLEDTTVGLEFVGQTAATVINSSTQEAQGPEDARIHGLRVQAGWYDWLDVFGLDQPPLNGLFGWSVGAMPDTNNDLTPEFILSAPTNELDIEETLEEFGYWSTHYWSRGFLGSIVVFTATEWTFSDNAVWRDKTGADGTNIIPTMPRDGKCDENNPNDRESWIPLDSFEIFAEDVTDFLHDGSHAGDVNLDSVPDILMGAPHNDRGSLEDTGATYILYGRPSFTGGNIDLSLADTPGERPPMVRIRGEKPGDRVGWKQVQALDVNGDRIDDIVLGAPYASYGGIAPTSCGGDFDGDGWVTEDDLSLSAFSGCEAAFGDEVFFDDACKAFDYNNDRVLDDCDRSVLECLIRSADIECCPSANGFVGVVFGGVTLDGDRTIGQIGTPDLPGARFFGANPGDLAGWDVASAGDFNRDNFGDILIAAPGETRVDENARTRLGVAYLIFGGTHLYNSTFSLQQVGTDALPGLVLISPFEIERPNEAPITTVSGIGDVNNDTFDDIGIGIPLADFVDVSLPQDPDDPGTDPNIGRRPDDGAAFILYGCNARGR